MASEKDSRQSSAGNQFVLGPEVTERAALESKPLAESVSSYFLTAAAESAWRRINEAWERPGGALLWISGPAGIGKTHFLNYVLALEDRAAPSDGRRATIALDLDNRAGGARNLETRLLDGLADALIADRRGASIWRQMRGLDAVEVALSEAARVGVRSVTIAIDMGGADSAPFEEYVAGLARVTSETRPPRVCIYLASRAKPAAAKLRDGAIMLDVAPSGAAEETIAAIARARRIVDEEGAEALYRGIETAGLAPQAICPFHPDALGAIRALAGPTGGIAGIAALVREALASLERPLATPIMAADLLEIPPFGRCATERLDAAGRAAFKIASAAAQRIPERERALANRIADALMLAWLERGASPVAINQLSARIPELRNRGRTPAEISAILAALAARADGTILYDERGAAFNTHAAGAPETARFNAALALARRFDSTLAPVNDLKELRAALKRLDAAMTDVLDSVPRVGAALAAADRTTTGTLARAHRLALDDFIDLVRGGAEGLMRRAADQPGREEVARVVAGFEALATAAAAIPRLAAMRDYLSATGLGSGFDPDNPGDKAAAALEVECQMLIVAFDSIVLPESRRNLDSIEARFHKFKWTYVEHYRIAHDRWRSAMVQAAATLDDARQHLAALVRLNTIPALGEPEGLDLAARVEQIAGSVNVCKAESALAIDVVPRCAECGFVLGTPAPNSDLTETLEGAKRALRSKLAALSQSAVARLIREHDRGRRLEGLLKIIQASQTEGLVRVLDDQLAEYLRSLLQEREEDILRLEPHAVRPLPARQRKNPRARMRSPAEAVRHPKHPPKQPR